MWVNPNLSFQSLSRDRRNALIINVLDGGYPHGWEWWRAHEAVNLSVRGSQNFGQNLGSYSSEQQLWAGRGGQWSGTSGAHLNPSTPEAMNPEHHEAMTPTGNDSNGQ